MKDIALGELKVGMLLHAIAEGGSTACRDCIVLSVDEAVIVAQAISTLEHFEFSLKDGRADGFVISSTKQPPADLWPAILAYFEKNKRRRTPEDARLSREEIDCILALARFYDGD